MSLKVSVGNNYFLTPNAKNDLQNIWNYTLEVWGEGKADEYIVEFFNRFEWLSEQPMLGKHRPEIKEGCYSYPQAEHIIFYELRNQYIAIIGIPHQSMDIDQFFDG